MGATELLLPPWNVWEMGVSEALIKTDQSLFLIIMISVTSGRSRKYLSKRHNYEVTRVKLLFTELLY